MAGFEERRRSPRVAVGGHYVCHAEQRVPVRLLDISAGGALLQTDEPLPVGAVGKLRLSLVGSPFESAVEVRREETAAGVRARLAGVSIVATQPRDRDALEDFLRRAGS